MARVTVEDCVDKIPNRFELVLISAQMAKDIASGAPLTVEPDNDKNAVIALRQIAGGNINLHHLRENLVESLRSHHKVDAIDSENLHAEAQESEEGSAYLEKTEDDVFTDDAYSDVELEQILQDSASEENN